MTTRIGIDLRRRIGTVDRAHLRPLHRAPRPLHLRRHLRGRLAARRRARLSPRRARRGAPAPLPGAPLAGRQLRERLSLARRGRAADDAAAAHRARVVRRGVQPLRRPTSSSSTAACSAPSRYICVNMGSGTMDEAQAWVEYCNGTGDTHWANLRRSHGYPEPLPRALLGARQRDVRRLADRQPERRGLREEGARLRHGDEADRPDHRAGRLRAQRLERLGRGGARRPRARSSTSTPSTSTPAASITTPPSCSRTRRSARCGSAPR